MLFKKGDLKGSFRENHIAEHLGIISTSMRVKIIFKIQQPRKYFPQAGYCQNAMIGMKIE